MTGADFDLPEVFPTTEVRALRAVLEGHDDEAKHLVAGLFSFERGGFVDALERLREMVLAS